MGSCRHDPPSFECAAQRRIRFALIPPERAFKNDVRVKDDNAFCGAAQERRRRGFDPLDRGVKLGRKHGAGEGCGTSKEGKGFGRIGRSLWKAKREDSSLGVFRRQPSAEERRYVSAFAFKLRDGLGDRRAGKVREFKSLNDFPAAVLRRAGEPEEEPLGNAVRTVGGNPHRYPAVPRTEDPVTDVVNGGGSGRGR